MPPMRVDDAGTLHGGEDQHPMSTMSPKPKGSKQRLAALDREVAALRLRQSGLTYQRIADRLGYRNRSGAWHAVHAALMATLQGPADELRTLELARLDRLQLAVWPKA